MVSFGCLLLEFFSCLLTFLKITDMFRIAKTSLKYGVLQTVGRYLQMAAVDFFLLLSETNFEVE
jgi:hypothetical protein